jgi:hypothetical protein
MKFGNFSLKFWGSGEWLIESTYLHSQHRNMHPITRQSLTSPQHTYTHNLIRSKELHQCINTVKVSKNKNMMAEHKLRVFTQPRSYKKHKEFNRMVINWERHPWQCLVFCYNVITIEKLHMKPTMHDS